MKYCKSCLYPETKPDIWFNKEGVCSACLSFEKRKSKDWKKWENKLHSIFRKYKGHYAYDCIVPVSGGKDSTYQIVKIKELGYNPIAVCARTDHLSGIGRKNLDNIANLGVDLMEINTNRKVRNKVARFALETIGDISWAEHVTIFTIPFIVSQQMNIPLIVYGENPQNEYGGPEGTEETHFMDTDWLSEFGGLNGLRVDDLIQMGVMSKQESFYYTAPEHVTTTKAIFLGQFIPWDGFENAQIARKNGFSFCPYPVEGNGSKYENLDNYQTGIHDYFKFIKFGFGRATDIANNLLRRDKLTRRQAKEFIREYDGVYPSSYLVQSLEDTLKPLDISTEKFHKICYQFTNKELFDIDEQTGRIKKRFRKDFDDA